MLVPHLETYLADHRSAIVALRGTSPASDALWLSMHGSLITDNGIYCLIVARTREGLGQPINPHLFRDCVATSIAIDTTRRMSESRPACSDIAPDRRPNAITTKRAASKRAAWCKNP
jgi:hypothetical protein